MFGYISPIPGELEQQVLQNYKCYYCGMCVSLAKRYGIFGRLTLSNDMTFLAILLSSLYEPVESHIDYRCPLHPVHTRRVTESRIIDYAADMNILLAYHKCLDDKLDERSLRGTVGLKLLQKAYRSIQEKYPQKCNVVQQAINAIRELEQANSLNVDELCRHTGIMVSQVFAYKEDAWRLPLKKIGYSLGGFIYLMDAYEDYDKDIKLHRFNPLISIHSQPNFDEFIVKALQLFVADATDEFSALPLQQHEDILRHILYRGLWAAYARMQKNKGNKKNEEQV